MKMEFESKGGKKFVRECEMLQFCNDKEYYNIVEFPDGKKFNVDAQRKELFQYLKGSA